MYAKPTVFFSTLFCTLFFFTSAFSQSSAELDSLFAHPPESASPGVLWMWMGSNISRRQITKDLEALKEAGFNRTTAFFLADVVNPWANKIAGSPTPELVAWSDPWWAMLKFALSECKRLGIEFSLFNGPGYESSGGPWITTEQSMKELIWSETRVAGIGAPTTCWLNLPNVDINPRAQEQFPVYNLQNGLIENPVIPARQTWFRDVAVLAMPATGPVRPDEVIDLSDKMSPDGTLHWTAPKGNWSVYRFGYTTRGTQIQPSQPEATGMECDKMSPEAVNFHLDHVIGALQAHVGEFIGDPLTAVHFDSYEAGIANWTPAMREEFRKRRGYDAIPWLGILAGRSVGTRADSLKFLLDFEATIKDLHRDVYFTVIRKRLNEAHLKFLAEPYGGPWRPDDVLPLVQNVMVEFWTDSGRFTPFELEPTVAALRHSGQNIIEAEAFTGQPAFSQWSEYPAWLKPIGDAAFCAGVNKMVVHRYTAQPWDDRYKPGNAMGQWGTHFDRTQTWWEPGKAMVRYWRRCQALLQWGAFVPRTADDFAATVTRDSLAIQFIHRRKETTELYFVANTTRRPGEADCVFGVSGKTIELLDPVSGEKRSLAGETTGDGHTKIHLTFAEAQSYFVIFGEASPALPPVAAASVVKEIRSAWRVQFDTAWGGPAAPVTMKTLKDWTAFDEPGIKYFSGTAVYSTSFSSPGTGHKALYLDLGKINHIARVILNGVDLGVAWTAPWRLRIPAGVLKNRNELRIEVTNVWANRLIGDEQEPDDLTWEPSQYFYYSGKSLKEFPDWFLQHRPRPSKHRYTFTTWNYFQKDSPLIPSGLLGPVTITAE